tara:strand:- start:2989 stop:3162 length:174 start_codon:yes stop_codon:yes gene_type:complete
MDTLKTILDSKMGTLAQGATGIGISYIEMLPVWLRIGIMLGVFLNVWIRLIREIRNN